MGDENKDHELKILSEENADLKKALVDMQINLDTLQDEVETLREVNNKLENNHRYNQGRIDAYEFVFRQMSQQI